MRRFTLSCTNVSFMPKPFAPPQPKHLFVGFGANVIVSVKFSQPLGFRYSVTSLLHSLFVSDKRNSASLRSPRAALPLAHLDAQEIRKRRDAAHDLLLVEARI